MISYVGHPELSEGGMFVRGGQPGCLSCGFTSSCHAAALRSSEVDILTWVPQSKA